MGQKMMIEPPKRLNAYSDLRRTSRVSPTKPGARSHTSETTVSNASTEVRVSEHALLFARLKEQLRALPDIRADRVEAVRQKFLDGVYRFDMENFGENSVEGDGA